MEKESNSPNPWLSQGSQAAKKYNARGAIAGAGSLGYAEAMRLEVTDLACQRSGRPVFDGVSFSVGSGQVLALRGPNGAGKSSLLRVLAGLLPASAGKVALEGVELGQDAERFTGRIAYAGHADAIKPQLSVAENLAFWAALFGARDASDAIAAFDLADIAHRPAHACSAGQKRRLGLARLALSRGRPLWLLDEPTVSLDPAASARLFSVIRNHCATGGAAIIATHIPLDLPNMTELALAPSLPVAPERAAARDPFLEGLMP